ncbi:MAG: hypothetical protein COT18_00760, partial [Elusimicrobia bacterium CG08_land_8_20_14_0_20_59_10]
MEEQINGLEGLNSELECFISDLHGREETLSARVKALEEELSAARSSADAGMNHMAQKEASLSLALEQVRASLLRESSKVVALTSERDELSRRLEADECLIEESKTALSEKEALLKGARAAAKSKADELSAAIAEAGASLLSEGSKVSALTTERDGLLRQLEGLSGRLEESRTLAAEKEKLLKETRASAKEESAKLSAAIEELRGSMKHDGDLLRSELARHDREAEELKAAAAKSMDSERRGLTAV